MRTFTCITAVVLGCAAAATTVRAQGAMQPAAPVSFGISAGLALPMGDFGDVVNAGFNINGLVRYTPTTLPITFRGELLFQHFGAKDDGVDAGGSSQVIAVVPSVVYDFTTQSSVKPYVLGGIGVYHTKFSASGTIEGIDIEGIDFDASSSSTDLGIHAGAGIRFPLSSITGFVEARIQDVFGDGSEYVFPISFGVTF